MATGRAAARLTNDQIQELVLHGTYYFPAAQHYNNRAFVVVGCDKCDTSGLRCCLGMNGGDIDLCLPCALEFILHTHCMGLSIPEATARVSEATIFEVFNNTPAEALRVWNSILLETDTLGRVTGGSLGYSQDADADADSDND
jgi:hypothetical protein